MAEAALVGALVAAYRPHIRGALESRGVRGVPGLDAALEAGERWLRAELGRLLALPYAEQRRGPLEVFQEAMRFPTAALEAAAVEPAFRDAVTVNALPGDRYDLAPASSRDLGEAVWQAHLEWGAQKARALGRPDPAG